MAPRIQGEVGSSVQKDPLQKSLEGRDCEGVLDGVHVRRCAVGSGDSRSIGDAFDMTVTGKCGTEIIMKEQIVRLDRGIRCLSEVFLKRLS